MQLTLDQAAQDADRLARVSRRAGNSASTRPSIQERFETFHHANPQIYAKLLEFALQMKRSGRREHYGVKALFERLRWHYDFEAQRTPGAGAFKINNDFTAYYARLLMENEPELRGFFQTRKAKGDG